MLDCLDIGDAAVCASRCSARGLVRGRVTAAVLVYDLGAHSGENRRARRVARRAAPFAGDAEGGGRGRRGCKAGTVIGRAAGELPAEAVAGGRHAWRETSRRSAARRSAELLAAGRRGRTGQGVWREMRWKLGLHGGQGGMWSSSSQDAGLRTVARQPRCKVQGARCSRAEQCQTKRAGESGRSVPKGAARAAREFYKTNIAACRTDGTSRKMLDCCRCRLQRECDSRVQPLAPSGKARTEVHSGALAFHAYAGRDRACQDHPAWPPTSAARRAAQSQYLDAQTASVFRRRRAASCCSSLVRRVRAPRAQQPRP